jgi:2,4-dienoyl-CoA reductase-like NADH-dependent reductase (Old Yellow Enzyme family)/thioredoxin reductase
MAPTVSSTSALFEPIEVGGIALCNRLTMPAMGTGLAGTDGHVNDELVAYYRRRAAGGIGMITVEASLINPSASAIGPELRLHGPEFVPGLRRLTDAVHAEGVPVGAQLWHPGRQTLLSRPVAPSPVPLGPNSPVPHVLTVEQIERLIGWFATSARHCREAGFDFVEIHAAHCYLPCEFLSPRSNLRTDGYGGDLRARARFLLELVAAVVDEVGAEIPVFCRVSGTEGTPAGLDVEDAVEVSRWLVDAGIRCLSVSAGSWHSLHLTIPPMTLERGALVPLAARVREAVDVPVVAVGRLDSPQLAAAVLEAGDADLIAVGRGLLADPEWPRKVRQNRAELIRPCIACNACLDLVARAQPARCAVNPELGREGSWSRERAAVPRRLMVIGGGPAGMEAARLAASRGHEVSLWEAEEELGGKLDVASRAPSKGELSRFRDYEVRALARLGVEVHTGRVVGAETVAAVAPDTVIVATGARAAMPAIVGVDGPGVVEAGDVLLGRVEVGAADRVAVVGGSATGCEAAEALAECAAAVTVLEMEPRAGSGIEAITRRRLLEALRRRGVAIETTAAVVRIEPGAVHVRRNGGPTERFDADLVVLATGWLACGAELAAAVEGPEVIVLGDAEQPADFVAAVNAAADAVLAL